MSRDAAPDRGSEDPDAEPEEPLLLSLDVADPTLRARLVDLLGELPDLHLVAAGEAADAVVSATHGPSPEGSPELTPRELEVLDILAEGASNREIAERLGISVHTAKFHVGSILEKLDSSGRTDAVAYALRVGVLRL